MVTASLAATSLACAHVTDAPSRGDRFAVTPPTWVTGAPAAGPSLEADLREGMAAGGVDATVIGSEPPTPECAENLDCLRELGASARADTLVIARLARLGPTTLLRLQSIDVAAGAMEHTLQLVIEDTDDQRLARNMRESAQRLARLYAPETPWYRRPIVLVAGAAVVTAAIVTAIVATRGSDVEPDVVVRPP